ncbi:hypothetical protein PUR71_06495 [Streptomyces sp. SP17BM10]|uniref:hypothetical protein n=1 Tax=Streptomyces sp. SP17BM10 TaxID=3002530 RepID=UPI002E77455D|nr:hypothetical protein [Streptomyces sp. SP17BM10]MEE1782571.1 hypothetical protein [Streptomyces sp. SP17BM10]
MTDEVGARALYEALLDYEGADAYPDVVTPWLDRALRAGHREALATAARFRTWWEDPGGRELTWELYALSRVSDHLLLEGSRNRQQYLAFFAALGMTPIEDDGPAFDPFHHEIAEVEQADDPNAPIEVIGLHWPGLMLGELLFGRAGARVRAGAAHAERGVADAWPLYWTFRRRHRPTVDLSQGWGSNSQWRTALRLDYRTADGDHLNVAESVPIDGRPDLPADHPKNLGEDDRLLTPTERRELLRHRTFLRAPGAVDALARSERWQRDFFPFEWSLDAPHGPRR